MLHSTRLASSNSGFQPIAGGASPVSPSAPTARMPVRKAPAALAKAATPSAKEPIKVDSQALLAFMLDEIDHAMLLVDGATLIHANRAARQELDGKRGGDHPLVVRDGVVTARRAADAAAIDEAILAAKERGTRKLLALGDKAQRVNVAVVPMAVTPGDDHAAVLLVLSKRQVCGDLAIFWFARTHGLTQAESVVLHALCKGHGPSEIAQKNAVAISTVRTQLASIRAKTLMPSLRELVNQVACLPPLVHALAGVRPH